MEYILLLVGFILLIKGADFFVEGSSSLAGILKVPSVIIGLTIVAMGTSAPEASVSINAALAGSNDIAISNVVGSNIFNGLVVVGICAFLHSFMPHGEILKRDMPLNILVTFVLCLMFLDGSLSRIEGAVLLLGMIVYLGFMIYSARKNREEGEPGKILSLPRSLLYIAGGLAAVIFGGDLVVDKACIIATNFGVSQNFIGLTIIAIGHLPAGAGDLHRCHEKGRQRTGAGQCHRLQPVQHPVYPRNVRGDQPSACPRRVCHRHRTAPWQCHSALRIRPYRQTHDPQRGGCVRASVCCIYGLPLREVTVRL